MNANRQGSRPQAAVVMGVAGVGKTTVGRRLAERLGWEFYDGDDFHPAANVDKMSRGVALTDGDRRVWLQRLRRLIARSLDEGRPAVVACSALKKAYRTTLLRGNEGTVIVYLRAPQDVVLDRVRTRKDHFFDPKLLATQYDELEEPDDAVTVDASRPPDAVVEEVLDALRVERPTRPPA